MLKERIRKWLELDKTDKKLEELAKKVSLIRENLEKQTAEIKQLIEELSETKAERDVVKELASRIDELEREIRMLEKFSLPKLKIQGISNEEQLKTKILTILSARGRTTISELQSLTGVGWKKFYKTLKELEKEKRIKIIKSKGRQKIVSLLTKQIE